MKSIHSMQNIKVKVLLLVLNDEFYGTNEKD
jgi:hypothetical protein